MARGSGFATQLPYLFMAAFFSYACYVQLNDPDKTIWIALYGVAALASFSATLGLMPLATLVSVAAAIGATALLSDRVLHPPSCEMGENVLDINGFKLSLDVNTENGRENAGVLIVLAWNLVAAVATSAASLSAGAALLLVAAAGSVLASAVLVPAFLMSPEKLKGYGHCSGLGITPDLLSGSASPAAAASAS